MARPYKQPSTAPSNPDCINAGKLGRGCKVLINIQPGCFDETCPFFKTEEENAAQERRCKARAEALGIKYKTREEIFSSYYHTKEVKRDYYDFVRNRQNDPGDPGERDQH